MFLVKYCDKSVHFIFIYGFLVFRRTTSLSPGLLYYPAKHFICLQKPLIGDNVDTSFLNEISVEGSSHALEG